MAVNTIEPNPRPIVLSRPLGLGWLTWDVVAYALIMLASVVAHLWGLERMALHHDESIHAWSSWRLYVGAGGFTCWGGRVAPTYCYDPVYHGPSLYYLTALAYFLFGDGDAQARLPMAVAGILMVASTWWLRPYLGKVGALVAAVLLAFSPSLLYYTRFARHDGLMVLFELWMLIGALRWIDTGRAHWLYLTAAALSLAIATHELYYILLFIFGVFVLMRLLAESRFSRYLSFFLLGMMAVCLLLMVVNPRIPVGEGLYFGEKAFLVASAFMLAWLCQRLWDPTPVLTPRLRELWAERRATLWVALAILGGIYLVLYSSFFAYMPGAVDGFYAGLAYWLGSQQEYARGDQPWYYYLMLLPLYEPLAVIAAIGTVVAMIVAVVRRAVAARRAPVASGIDEPAELDPTVVAPPTEGDAPDLPAKRMRTAEPSADAALGPQPLKHWELYPLLVVFWFWTAVIIFSWAGEKMPWLVVHMALPGNLLAAWVIARLVEAVQPRPTALDEWPEDAARPGALSSRRARIWLVPVLTLLTGVALGVALWRFGISGEGQAAQQNLLQGLVPLLIAGGLIYALLTLASGLGGRAVLAAAGLTLAVVIGGYTVRAAWKAVYEHPDVPIELLVYTQSAPDVPRIVADVRELAVNLTRSARTPEDATGGLTMPIVLDSGDEGGDGSLAWPLQWYLRDFKRVAWTKKDTFQGDPATAFEVQLPDGSTGLAPVVMLYKPHVTEQVRQALGEHYVQPYGETSVFNWWFPEGDKCAPQSPGYKRFYYSTWTSAEELGSSAAGGAGECGRDISQEVHGPYAALVEPFRRENWGWMHKFVLYRELPYPLVPGAREMEVWLRSDLAGGAGEAGGVGGGGSPVLRLVAQQAVDLPAGGSGPTGLAADSQGRLYIADTGSHQILVFSPDGQLQRTIGGFGADLGQLYEPRGVAVDAQGNLYVADTWNARVVKFGPDGRALATWGSGDQDLGDGRRATITEGTLEGNEANPLGLFGPRGVAVDGQGNVYIADTGNKRIVVTDSEGAFRYQFGYGGAELGAFNEPTGVAVDSQGNVYVADTWNGRVQVFAPDGTGRVGSIPIVTWRVSGWRPNTYDDPTLAVGDDGRVYVSVPSRNEVIAFNLRGDLLLRWGGPGEDLASLNSPSGLAQAPDSSVWVADRARNRVLRFELPNVQAP